MKIYQLKAKQILPISVEEAWEFISNPENLKTITPDAMGFNILTAKEEKMYAGQIICYKVTPLLGIKTSWVTEITQVKEGEYFVDEQRFGPYSMWHHKHFITPVPGGVLMEDIVDYKIPMGILGQFAHAVVVKKQLKEIFLYRNTKLEELFGTVKQQKPELIFKSF